jgi:hypothetical protein
MPLLARLFGRRRPEAADPRTLLETRSPPWHRVTPAVIDAIFEALADPEQLDDFLRASMDKKLVRQYNKLGRQGRNVTLARVQMSTILCRAGFHDITVLGKALKKGRATELNANGPLTVTLFEAAISLSPDQIPAYVGMATVYGLLSIPAKRDEYTRRGLIQLSELRRREPIIKDNDIPADAYDIMERRLRSLLP